MENTQTNHQLLAIRLRWLNWLSKPIVAIWNFIVESMSYVWSIIKLAWAGMTEEEAKSQGISYGKGTFPWAASGRSLALERDEGLTKILFEEETKKIIGIGIVGPNAGDLIAEGVLAIEMGADATDIGASIHPHPTLSETLGLAAEAYEGTITDLYLPKRR